MGWGGGTEWSSRQAMTQFDGKKLISSNKKLEKGMSVQWEKEHAVWHLAGLF